MKLHIVRISDRGVPNNERLHLAVDFLTDLSFFVVFDTNIITDTTISASPKNTYWFLPTPVQAGDNVILYTGYGTKSSNRRADGGTDYFFYWGLPKTIWGEADSRAVLLEVLSWETSKL